MAGHTGHPSARRRLEAAEQDARAAGLLPIARRAAMARHALGPAVAVGDPGNTTRSSWWPTGARRSRSPPASRSRRSTVESHIASAVRKLGARNRRQAAPMLEARR